MAIVKTGIWIPAFAGMTKGRRHGLALPLVLSVMIILALAGMTMLQIGSFRRIAAIRRTCQLKARCAADAGLTAAIYELNARVHAGEWNPNALPSSGDIILTNSAIYSYSITTESGNLVIASVGTSNQATRTIYAPISIKGPFDFTIFGKNKVEIKANAHVTSINDDEDSAPLQIGTESTNIAAISLKNGSSIDGNVVVGAGADPDDVIKDQGCDITGTKYSMPMPQSLVPVKVPDEIVALPMQAAIQDSRIIANSGKYSKIDIGTNAKVEINGNVVLYVTGDIIVGNGAEIVVNENSSLTLYLAGDLEGKNGSNFNNLTHDSTKFQIFGTDTCESIIFKNSSQLYGAVYAPSGDVIFNNGADAYGSVVGKTFTQNNSSNFYYDHNLKNVNDQGLIRFEIGAWYENEN